MAKVVIDDRSFDIPFFSPQCTFCKHFDVNWENLPGRCAAYDVIPKDIWRGRRDHSKPAQGDRGIRFDSIDAEAADQVAGLFDGRVTPHLSNEEILEMANKETRDVLDLAPNARS